MSTTVDFLIHQGVALATPILLAAMGALLIESSGVFFLAMEGSMLTGALAAAVAAEYYQSAGAGMAAGCAAAMAFHGLFAWVVLTFRAGEVVTGAAMNLLASGATAVLWRATYGMSTAATSAPGIIDINIPWLSEIPVLGSLLFRHHGITYITFAVIPAVWFFLQRTAPGLALRACGEDPKSAAALGLRPARIRALALLAGGALGGLAGASLVVAESRSFMDDMTAGRGFVAIALVIFGAHHPVWVALASLLFGLALALQFYLQAGTGGVVPPEFLRVLPHLFSLLILAGITGRRRAPAALGRGL